MTLLGVVLLAALALPAVYARDDEQDWPCIQGLVWEVAPSVIWAGPPVEDYLETWYREPGVSRTVEALIRRRVTDEERQKTLDDWLQTVPEAEREAQLTAVFTGVLTRLNGRRRDFIEGILRYARHQKAVSEQIQAHLNEIAALRGKTDEESIRRLVEIEETVKWEQRIFDQRESHVVLLCEQPVQVEEEMGDIARLIASRLE